MATTKGNNLEKKVLKKQCQTDTIYQSLFSASICYFTNPYNNPVKLTLPSLLFKILYCFLKGGTFSKVVHIYIKTIFLFLKTVLVLLLMLVSLGSVSYFLQGLKLGLFLI